ncbi:hypothetical protein 16Q_152 [Pseudomonas phage 16Q]|nr:hypothetical protein 16Q_152 [Pseudomonas phage 16Q]
MTKSQMVKEAMEYNRCLIIARRDAAKLPATIAGFAERRDTLMKKARAF